MSKTVPIGKTPAKPKRTGKSTRPPVRPAFVHRFLIVEFLLAYADPDHEEHASMVQWAGEDFDPEAFNPETVKFDDPRKRWKKAFVMEWSG